MLTDKSVIVELLSIDKPELSEEVFTLARVMPGLAPERFNLPFAPLRLRELVFCICPLPSRVSAFATARAEPEYFSVLPLLNLIAEFACSTMSELRSNVWAEVSPMVNEPPFRVMPPTTRLSGFFQSRLPLELSWTPPLRVSSVLSLQVSFSFALSRTSFWPTVKDGTD